MKQLAISLSVLVAFVGVAATQFIEKTVGTFDAGVVAVAPTDAGDGVTLSNATGYSVTVSAVQSYFIMDGGGTLYCYAYVCVNAPDQTGASCTRRWMRCDSTLDVALTGGLGQRDYTSTEFEAVVGHGRVAYRPNMLGMHNADGGDLATDGGWNGGVNITYHVRRTY